MNALLEAPNQIDVKFSDPDEQRLGRVLVVDDDVDIRHLTIEALTASGYEVDDAENGERAWKALHLKSYDLLITDHEMPHLTGLQLIDKLRAAGFEPPIILASGGLRPELTAKIPQLRFVTLLPKPFALEELIQTVTRLLPARLDRTVVQPLRNLASNHGNLASYGSRISRF